MDAPNEILSTIYGTLGAEKVASPSGEGHLDLHDYALYLVSEEMGEDADGAEKVAAAQAKLDNLIEYDRAGRAQAQVEFSNMEQMAAEGDWSALETFYGDIEIVEDEKTAAVAFTRAGHKNTSEVARARERFHTSMAKADQRYLDDAPFLGNLQGMGANPLINKLLARRANYVAKQHAKRKQSLNPFRGLGQKTDDEKAQAALRASLEKKKKSKS
jgi:hypothetical protein